MLIYSMLGSIILKVIVKYFPNRWKKCLFFVCSFSNKCLQTMSYSFTYLSIHCLPFLECQILWAVTLSFPSLNPQSLTQQLAHQRCPSSCCWFNYIKAMCSNKYVGIQAPATFPQQCLSPIYQWIWVEQVTCPSDQ